MDKMWKYFQCQRCGACCTKIGLPYDGESVHNIANFLKMSVEKIIEKYYGNITSDGSYWESDDSKRTPCPFLRFSDEKYFCEIHLVRPLGCKLYPIDTVRGRDGIDCPAWEIAFSRVKKEQEDDL